MTASPQISGLASQNSQVTLQRLSDAVWLREGAAGTPTNQTTQPTGSTGPTINRDVDRADFEALDDVIKGLGPLVKKLKATAARYEFQSVEARDAAIDRALEPFRASRSGKFPGGIRADLDETLVTDVALKGRGFKAGEEVELVLTQTEQAELASLFLELGADAFSGINLGGDGGALTFEISGAGGSQSLSFSSGQTLGQIAAAITGFADATGVQATVSGTGVVLSSTAFGSGGFTTVAIADDGGIRDNGSGNTLGIYALAEDGSGDAEASGFALTSTGAATGVTDEGKDAVVEINGVRAEQIGDYWVASLDKLDVAIDLDEEALADAENGPVSLGTVGKPKHGHGHRHGHDDHDEIRGAHGRRGHRGHGRGHGVGEGKHHEREKRTDSAERSGGLLPTPTDEGSGSKVAEPQRRLDTEV